MFGWVKKIFKRSAEKPAVVIKDAPLTSAEQLLLSWNIRFDRQKDGTIYVPGDLNLSNMGLRELPDLSNVVLKGNFSCSQNNLTSLKGAPKMFASLLSDFGMFWEGNIPQQLRNPPAKKAPPTGDFSL